MVRQRFLNLAGYLQNCIMKTKLADTDIVVRTGRTAIQNGFIYIIWLIWQIKISCKRRMNNMHYCYVYGGLRNLNFYGWLSNMSIERLRNEGCTVEIRDYWYTE